MRAGHKYVEAVRTTVDQTPEEFAATMGYGSGLHGSREEFLAAYDERWVHELHAVYRELLEPGRTTLSIGSGAGEHDVLLHRAGYNVVASDVVEGALDDAARLWPGLRTMTFDVFSPTPVECDDVLVTGLDFYFRDDAVVQLLTTIRDLVHPGGRCVFTMRYVETPASWMIDRVLLPALAAHGRIRGRRLVRKHHGYRRTRRELVALAERAGLHAGRIRHAAFGMELARVAPVPARVVRLDQRLHLLNSATVIELLPAS